MTKQEAHKVLDDARSGIDTSEAEIMAAHQVTGDVEDAPIQIVRKPGTWGAIQRAPAGFWDGLAA